MLKEPVLDVTPFLFHGKGQRVCDVKTYLPGSSEEDIKVALEFGVQKGNIEKYNQNGVELFLKKIQV